MALVGLFAAAPAASADPVAGPSAGDPIATDVSAGEARARVGALMAPFGEVLARRAAATARIQLRELSLAGRSRRAWRARLPWLAPWPWAPEFWLDARDGRLLAVRDQARRRNEAKLFARSGEDGATTTVTLDGLDDPEGRLRGRWSTVRACVDRGRIGSLAIFGFDLSAHTCQPRFRARPDDAGDYPATPGNPRDPNDAFAELMVYHHLHQASTWLETLGFAGTGDRPIEALVNFRIPLDLRDPPTTPPEIVAAFQQARDPAGRLFPFANAFAISARPEGGSDDDGAPFAQFVFGQGDVTDAAWDGDVIIHELGHAVWGRLGLTTEPRWRPEASANDAGALHEGLSDVLAAAWFDDPAMAVHFNRNFDDDHSPLRHVANDHRCPDHLVGAVHTDGLPFAAAVWEARTGALAAGATAVAVDSALLAAVRALPSSPLFGEAADVFESTWRDRLGEAAGAAAEAAFAARGLLDCERVVDGQLGATWPRTLFVPGAPEGGEALGPLQFRLDVPADVAGLELTFDHVAVASLTQLLARLLGLEPKPAVAWRLDRPVRMDADADDRAAHDGDGAAEAILEDGRWRVTLPAPAGGGPLWIALLNLGPGGYSAPALTIRSLDSERGSDIGPPPAGGADASHHADVAPPPTARIRLGGGCAAPDTPRGAAPAVLSLALFALAIRRRSQEASPPRRSP